MKTIWLWSALLVIGSSENHAQIILKTGESYTYHFDSLPFRNHSTFGIPGPSGIVFQYLDPQYPQDLGTNSYRLEMFEDTAGVPILSRTVTAATSIFDTDFCATNIWGDLNGSFRITAVAGSIAVRGFSLQAIRTSAAGGFDVYATDRVFLPAAPVLSITHCDGLAMVRWTTPATNFVLEASSSATSTASWQAVTNPVVAKRDVFTVKLRLDESCQFFRLRSDP